MKKFEMRDFLITQPSYPEISETDPYYLGVANKVLEICLDSDLKHIIHEAVLAKMAMTLACYFEDIVADAGIWRSFVEANRKLYNFTVPFHPVGEEYVDYELNREDVRFLVWYAIAMFDDHHRDIYPHDPAILQTAEAAYSYLESIYDDAPDPKNFHPARGIDLVDPNDQGEIVKFGQWLFLHCYLMTPSFSASLMEMMTSPEAQKAEDLTMFVNERLEQAIIEMPFGPIALYMQEWLTLIFENRLIDVTKIPPTGKKHLYYEKFVAATNGETVKFFDSYEEMNKFFISALGWEKDTEHLAQAKGADDYVLMVNPVKGMLMARDVAKCLAAPTNPFYDKEYARMHSFELISQRGRCPADLLRRAAADGWLRDACFPGSDDHALVADNLDFLARCYLQLYYRD